MDRDMQKNAAFAHWLKQRRISIDLTQEELCIAYDGCIAAKLWLMLIYATPPAHGSRLPQERMKRSGCGGCNPDTPSRTTCVARVHDRVTYGTLVLLHPLLWPRTRLTNTVTKRNH